MAPFVPDLTSTESIFCPLAIRNTFIIIAPNNNNYLVIIGGNNNYFRLKLGAEMRFSGKQSGQIVRM